MSNNYDLFSAQNLVAGQVGLIEFGHNTVVTCKIKHLQKCFRAVDFPQLRRGRKNVAKMFYFTCNHPLSSTCVQHAKTFAKHLQKKF